ncbi:MAG: YeeE/YedE thiosulfate transporter family protein [Deltaproteobacteria bacterium]|nr:YeeE/YedE thiosulfate transporter family protein [Deltaproteobacteria bacterium]
MTEFTPGSALAGGALIGAASGWLLLADGRIAGVSGILGGALGPAAAGERRWRVAFLLGLPAGFLLHAWVAGAPAPVQIESPLLVLVAAGLLVGFGTRLGSGCTSGHGICGVARASPRSLAATATFLASGFATVFAWRHLLGGGS